MLTFPIEVTPDGGDPYKVVATSRDVRQWERTTKGASLASLQSDMKMTDVYAIAFHAAKRLGHYQGTLADFESTCDLDVLNDEVQEVDPTRTDP